MVCGWRPIFISFDNNNVNKMENNMEYNNNNETSIFIGNNNTTYDEYVLFEWTEKQVDG